MYKGRLGIWVSAVVICVIVSLAMQWVPVWFASSDMNIGVNVETDPDFAQVLANDKINGIKLHIRDDNPDVLITDANLEHTTDYKIYNDVLYSPIVMFACGVYNYSEGFINVAGSNYKYKVDLYSILTAIESGAEWESLGFNKNVANGKVTLYIPSEQCSYYSDVVDLFYMTLNNGKMPDETTRESLKPRVNTILSQCNKVTDITQAINDEYSHPSKTHKIFIGPEYIYKRGNGSSLGSSTDSNKQFRPVYFQHTVYLNADIYVKKIDGVGNDVGEKFVENIKNKLHFMRETGWRITNSTFDLSDLSSVYIEKP